MSSRYEHYSMVIQWSEENDAYLVTIPEFPGLITHGDTYEEAAKNGQEVLEVWIEACEESGRPIPAPRVMKKSA